jgi:RNA polymerase sigma factor (sigma-70 family)
VSPEERREGTRAVVEAVFRIESPKLIARLARMLGDVGRAEELAQDALVLALEKWPDGGVPENPGAWLMTSAKHRAINEIVRRRRLGAKHEALGHAQGDDERRDPAPELDASIDDPVGDDLLRLVFVACHPVLTREARLALTLRLLGGLTTEEIARAFLLPEPTIAQRIVRAKKTLADEKVPFEVPSKDELGTRLASVLEVIYLVFNEGYAATAGDDWMRPALCAEAMRLGRVLVGLVAREAEAHGLVALMELHAARAPARLSADGVPVLLADQDRTRWDRLLARRGLAALAEAEALAGAAGQTRGFYTLQAAISACHTRAATAAATDWRTIAALYGELVHITGSPVVEVNRAVAVGMAEGSAAGLAILDALGDHPALAGYHLLPAARGDLLEKLGRAADARAAFARAAALTKNERERAVLEARAAACTRA